MNKTNKNLNDKERYAKAKKEFLKMMLIIHETNSEDNLLRNVDIAKVNEIYNKL